MQFKVGCLFVLSYHRQRNPADKFVFSNRSVFGGTVVFVDRNLGYEVVINLRAYESGEFGKGSR